MPRAVAVVERDGKVLVIRRHLDGRDYAVLPGGGIEAGESPAEAALRELREECTLDGQVAELLLEGDHGGRIAFYYRVTGVEGEPVLGGGEAEHQDETNSHHPMWAGPKDLDAAGPAARGPDRARRCAGSGRSTSTSPRTTTTGRSSSAVAALLPRPVGVPRYDAQARRHVPAGPPRRGTDRRRRRRGLRTSRGWATGPIGSRWCAGSAGDRRHLGEFFVVRSARGAGYARGFAEHVVRAHPGPWEIAFQEDNAAAARFWRRLGAEVLTDVEEELREVPDKPYLPPDVWLTRDRAPVTIELPAGVLAMRGRGDDWAAWVDRLPALARDLLDEWELTVDGDADARLLLARGAGADRRRPARRAQAAQ